MAFFKKIVILKPCENNFPNALIKIENSSGGNKCLVSALKLPLINDVYYFCIMGESLKTVDLGKGGVIKKEFFIENNEDLNFAVISFNGEDIMPVYFGYTIKNDSKNLVNKLCDKLTGKNISLPSKEQSTSYKEILKNDYYLHEDTTLSDAIDENINMIAKENYFDYDNKENGVNNKNNFDFDNFKKEDVMNDIKEVLKESLKDIVEFLKKDISQDLKNSLKKIISEIKNEEIKGENKFADKNNTLKDNMTDKNEDNFFNSFASSNSLNKENSASNEQNPQATYYDSVKWQIEEMFNQYPRFEKMEKAVDNSKFVKVEYNDSHYLVGVLTDPETQNVNFILYAVPGIYSNTPPEELKGHAQWVPLDKDAPDKEGYWLLFQSAKTGENVEII